jgi:esterase/lipase
MPQASLVNKLVNGFFFGQASCIKQLKKSKTPTLFIHGDKDDFVPIDHTVNAYNDCTSKKEIVIFEGADHVIASLMHKEKYENHVIKFIEEN